MQKGVFRKAKMSDARKIHNLIDYFAQKREMLPRPLQEIYEFLRDFWVYEEEGEIRGVCALHFAWEDLAEIRSLAVDPEVQAKGIGKKLVEKCIEEAGEYNIKKIFALTYHPDFFVKLGFQKIDKKILPHKIWADCLKCPLFPDCNEEAVMLECKNGKDN